MHGLFDDGYTFLLHKNPEQNLAFIFSNLGYDVWVGNSRGSTISYEHLDKLNHNHLNWNGNYWDFSLDELAKFDWPSIINYICKKTLY